MTTTTIETGRRFRLLPNRFRRDKPRLNRHLRAIKRIQRGDKWIHAFYVVTFLFNFVCALAYFYTGQIAGSVWNAVCGGLIMGMWVIAVNARRLSRHQRAYWSRLAGERAIRWDDKSREAEKLPGDREFYSHLRDVELNQWLLPEEWPERFKQSPPV